MNDKLTKNEIAGKSNVFQRTFKYLKEYFVLIDIILILSGWISIAVIKYWLPSLTFQSTLENIGTGLIAAAITDILVRNFIRSLQEEKEIQTRREMQLRLDYASIQDGIVTILDIKRSRLVPSIKDEKLHAEKVDLLGVALGAVLEETACDVENKLLIRVLRNGVRFRAIFIDPEAPIVKQRWEEDKHSSIGSLIDMIKQSVRNSIEIYKKMCEVYLDCVKKRIDLRNVSNELIIKLTDSCPYLTIYRVDDDYRWGLYLSSAQGSESPLFLTRRGVGRKQTDLADMLNDHFKNLLVKPLVGHPGPGKLVSYTPGGIPNLDVDLACRILGPGMMVKLLGSNWHTVNETFEQRVKAVR